MNHRSTLLVLMMMLSLLSGCVNPHNLLKEGNIERAYTVSKRQVDQRINRQKSFRGAELDVLLASYTLLQEQLIQKVDAIASQREPNRWLSLYPIYQKLLARRQEIDPYLSLYRRADPIYDIASLEALVENARLQAGAYCQSEAQKHVEAARAGDKPAARTAHQWLGKSLEYVPEATENARLQAEMFDLGTVRVFLEPAPSTPYYGPQLLAYTLEGRRPTRNSWLEIHFSVPESRIDYIVPVEIADAYVGPDYETSSTEYFSKEIEDGCIIVEKQVASGDTVITVQERVPVIITVSGTVTTVNQYKSSDASAYVHVLTGQGALYRDTWVIGTSNSWSNSYQICSGDSRALPTCFGFYSSPPFDSYMLNGLGDNLRAKLIADICAMFPDATSNCRRRWSSF